LTYFDQSAFDVRCEWGLQAMEQLAPTRIVVIVDVLSFTTSVDVAVSRGGRVLPCRWKDEAAARYAQEQQAVLAGPRTTDTGRPSLAPSSLLDIPRGLRIVLPSPNGSALSFEAKSRGMTVVACCLRNASAVAQWVNAGDGPVMVVPAGERWPDSSLRPAFEDLVGAGAIIRELKGNRSPEAEATIAAFERAAGELTQQLLACASGRELVERGFQRDVEIAAALNESQTVPVFQGDEFIPAAPR
jgi:2-phosphosulfolactate phosphatase